ncbi:MAG: succinate--CoA ligase subunit alpha [bacterium]|nr:succinate--CoA ligase subunit alpha [bacterium]MDZ4231666.1 succinate--CoA ligase subunit alpha [Candidatus Pacearchaeota archaeon]
MSILVDENTKVLVQGITGKEGSRAAHEMLAYGTKVLAGVTPGKGGQTTEDGVPVFNSVKEAVAQFPEINTALIVVPPQFVGAAAAESIEADIPLIDILTEKVPVAQVATMIALARKHGVVLVGPSSVGIISPKKGKIGSIGSSELVHTIFSKGNIGVISKSGGMTAEVSRILTDADLGQSTVIGIGGDLLIGADFVDIARLFEKDEDTKAIVIFGEVGGTYEEQLAREMKSGSISKPVVALIAGQFSEKLPQDTVLGHAGAIVSKGRGSAASKIAALKEAGALIADTPEDIPGLVRKALQK